MITDYIKDVDVYRCSIDNDIIFNPAEEGTDCAWFESITGKHENTIKRIIDWLTERDEVQP